MSLAVGKNLVIFVVLPPTFMIGVSFRACKSHLDELARHVHANKVSLFSKMLKLFTGSSLVVATGARRGIVDR
ncbi:hypothetical protein KCU93_g132, partial [Aureobasidium melanogenum]